MSEQRDEQLEVMLVTMCAMQIALEGMDYLEGTNIWMHKTKMSGNSFKREIEKAINKNIEKMYQDDEEMAQALIDSLHNAMEGIVKEDPVEIIKKFYVKD